MGARFAFDGTERVVSATSQRFGESFPETVPGPEFEELGGVGGQFRGQVQVRTVDRLFLGIIYRECSIAHRALCAFA